MNVQPYLMFGGRCQEAADFYGNALGAKVQMAIHFKDSPDQSMVTPDNRDKVMHMRLRIGDSIMLLSDGRCGGNPTFDGFSMSINVDSAAEAERYFAALSEGGKVQMPLTRTFFSPAFGMLADRFGVSWMIHVETSN